MLFPERRFGLVNNSNNLFDYLFSDPVFNVNTTTNRMSTDIKEKENGYELSMEVPGFDKEDLKLELEKGYLSKHSGVYNFDSLFNVTDEELEKFELEFPKKEKREPRDTDL